MDGGLTYNNLGSGVNMLVIDGKYGYVKIYKNFNTANPSNEIAT